ncbi:PREDICTED: uncharacterized protein LOC109339373 [Lupinus angustifolius]|uniref:uncharacterized protein LOC109339373 n=1 Tax=Lupinus angustifolius TaxID=3871 RepID=UPI00092E2DFA|nr:PREDICTED: uncharacterized protein LOC109339373 [Lupinus angustifolius]
MKTLWDELEIFRPLAKCNCDSERFRTEDKVIRFLKGLNDSYSSVRSQIMLMEPLPNMNKVLSMVIQQETQMYGSESEAKTMNIGTNWKKNTPYSKDAGQANKGFTKGYQNYNKSPWNKSSNSSKFCTHCKKPGHTVENCYRIHGFPPNFKFTKNQQINFVTFGNELEQQKGDDASYGLTNEKYQSLISILQKQTNQKKDPSTAENMAKTLSTSSTHRDHNEEGKSISQWILDSGATYHIAYNMSYYSAYHKIKPIRVKLPNRHEVLATISGIIVISKSLTIHDVLYLPSFSYNLLSIPKLTSQSSCILSFDASCCKIQEKDSLKMIGIANLSKGLYVLKGAKLAYTANFSVSNSVIVPKNRIWHYRLARPLQILYRYN